MIVVLVVVLLQYESMQLMIAWSKNCFQSQSVKNIGNHQRCCLTEVIRIAYSWFIMTFQRTDDNVILVEICPFIKSNSFRSIKSNSFRSIKSNSFRSIKSNSFRSIYWYHGTFIVKFLQFSFRDSKIFTICCYFYNIRKIS